MHASEQIIEISNRNHPKLGDTIKVEPIRTLNAINSLKKYLAPFPRNFGLFVVGINTAYRASELLSIRVGQVQHLQPGDRLEVKQRKTQKYRAVTVNTAATKQFKSYSITWIRNRGSSKTYRGSMMMPFCSLVAGRIDRSLYLR